MHYDNEIQGLSAIKDWFHSSIKNTGLFPLLYIWK